MTDDQALSQTERIALSSVLDEIIPARAEADLPGAGGLGLTSDIEAAVAQNPDLHAVVAQGLARLAALAAGRGAVDFVGLEPEARLDVLNELATQAPGFLPSLIFPTYVGYYQNPRVVEALGLEARPPYPLGYDLEMGDLSLLDAVRARTKFYRDV